MELKRLKPVHTPRRARDRTPFLLGGCVMLSLISAYVQFQTAAKQREWSERLSGQWIRHQQKNMLETVSPILEAFAWEKCGSPEIFRDVDGWYHAAGTLVYKREFAGTASQECIKQPGNVFYIRCYDYKREANRVVYRRIRDVPTGAYSCLPESELAIPDFNREVHALTPGREAAND